MIEPEICACQTPDAFAAAGRLAHALWPDESAETRAEELAALARVGDAAALLARWGGAEAGFAQVGLRRDYVEGTGTSPVGYLEGVYVAPAFRGRGVGRALVAACEDWARARGCAEFASDAELPNDDSHAFHRRIGFEEVNRIVCYVKRL